VVTFWILTSCLELRRRADVSLEMAFLYAGLWRNGRIP
jgi:hypothetical protein